MIFDSAILKKIYEDKGVIQVKKDIIKKLLNLFLFVAFFFTVYYSYDYITLEYEKYKISNNLKDELAVIKNVEEELNNLEYYKNYYSNNDIVGKLKISNTNIDTLLVKTTDNEYYLNHSLNKEYDIIGSIYVDYRTELNSKQINIYGHNSNVYNVMFKELENYLDKEYYENHKYIELWNGDEYIEYEIFSVQIVTTDYEHIDVIPSNWEKHISILNKSIYDTNIKANKEDDILVIQTCLYNPANSFLIINSRKV